MLQPANNQRISLWQALRPDWDSIETVLLQGKGLALDLGAGNGRHKEVIENAGYQWIGCDFAEHSGISLRADAHNLPFLNNTFGLIVIWQAMEYLHNPYQVMSEIQRVLKPGGIIIGSVSFLEPMHGRVYFNFSQYGLEELLRQNGFCDIFLSPGIGCFPLICWTWIRQLTGSEFLAKIGLWVERLGIWGISIIFDKVSALKYRLGAGNNFKGHWLREVMPFSYAGQITFRATKDKDS
jgi:SAM-dependent methyltransferase